VRTLVGEVGDLPAKLTAIRERIAHYALLLAESSAAADAARAALKQPSTYPRLRRVVEAELSSAMMDLGWIRPDLAALVNRERLLQADLGQMMADDLALAATEKARAAKAGKARGTKRAKPPTAGETKVANNQVEAPAGASGTNL
jgi:hypothetical protein